MMAAFNAGDLNIQGTDIPIFLYGDYTYNPDKPEEGLFQRAFFVCVSSHLLSIYFYVLMPLLSTGSH